MTATALVRPCEMTMPQVPRSLASSCRACSHACGAGAGAAHSGSAAAHSSASSSSGDGHKDQPASDAVTTPVASRDGGTDTPDSESEDSSTTGSAQAQHPTQALPLCSNDVSPGHWDCPILPKQFPPQLASTCGVEPSPWHPNGCQLLPPLDRERRSEQVCDLLTSKYDVSCRVL